MDELRRLRLRLEVEAERRDRVEDVALQLELLRASWAGVDRRLGPIERSLARHDERGPARAARSAGTTTCGRTRATAPRPRATAAAPSRIGA